MGGKLLWTGLTIILAFTVVFPQVIPLTIVGAIFMILGLILLWLDK